MALAERTMAATRIGGLVVVTVKHVTDGRGTVREFYRRSDDHADPEPFLVAQVNVTWSRHGAIRGFHGEVMRKLVGVVAGEAYGAYLDVRPGSPTYGVIETVSLLPGVQVIVPVGVLNAFQCVAQAGCEYLYAFDAEWSPGGSAVGVNPLDPELAVGWPIEIDPADRSLLSEKDAALPVLAELAQ